MFATTKKDDDMKFYDGYFFFVNSFIQIDWINFIDKNFTRTRYD